MSKETPTWEQWLNERHEWAKHNLAQVELIASNPTMNQFVGFSWIQDLYRLIVDIYYTLLKTREGSEVTRETLRQILNADKSVPVEELQARAELLGLFVQALRERTQGAPP